MCSFIRAVCRKRKWKSSEHETIQRVSLGACPNLEVRTVRKS